MGEISNFIIGFSLGIFFAIIFLVTIWAIFRTTRLEQIRRENRLIDNLIKETKKRRKQFLRRDKNEMVRK